MSETKTAKDYFKNCFQPKLLIQKAIIAACALILVLAFSLSFYLWLKDCNDGTFGQENGFWYLHITWNPGIGWSALSGNPGTIYAIQTLMFVILLGIFLLLSHDKITSSFVALAMFGGLFNLFQRIGAPAEHAHMVLDYFIFGFWPDFPIFNWPDTFVVIGIFGFIISYIVLLIIQTVNDNQKTPTSDEKVNNEQPNQPQQPQQPQQ